MKFCSPIYRSMLMLFKRCQPYANKTGINCVCQGLNGLRRSLNGLSGSSWSASGWGWTIYLVKFLPVLRTLIYIKLVFIFGTPCWGRYFCFTLSPCGRRLTSDCRHRIPPYLKRSTCSSTLSLSLPPPETRRIVQPAPGFATAFRGFTFIIPCVGIPSQACIHTQIHIQITSAYKLKYRSYKKIPFIFLYFIFTK